MIIKKFLPQLQKNLLWNIKNGDSIKWWDSPELKNGTNTSANTKKEAF